MIFIYNPLQLKTAESSKKKLGLSRALDPHAKGVSLSKLTEFHLKSLSWWTENRSEEKEGMVERLGEMRKGRRERIEKGSREKIDIERKETQEN